MCKPQILTGRAQGERYFCSHGNVAQYTFCDVGLGTDWANRLLELVQLMTPIPCFNTA